MDRDRRGHRRRGVHVQVVHLEASQSVSQSVSINPGVAKRWRGWGRSGRALRTRWFIPQRPAQPWIRQSKAKTPSAVARSPLRVRVFNSQEHEPFVPFRTFRRVTHPAVDDGGGLGLDEQGHGVDVPAVEPGVAVVAEAGAGAVGARSVSAARLAVGGADGAGPVLRGQALPPRPHHLANPLARLDLVCRQSGNGRVVSDVSTSDVFDTGF
eukprot:9480635-Pyramimonas_sp.AAC.4